MRAGESATDRRFCSRPGERLAGALVTAVASMLIAASAAAAPLLFRDDFNRADGPLGSNWNVISGTQTIISGRACTPTAGSGFSLSAVEADPSAAIAMRVKGALPGAGSLFGLILADFDAGSVLTFMLVPASSANRLEIQSLGSLLCSSSTFAVTTGAAYILDAVLGPDGSVYLSLTNESGAIAGQVACNIGVQSVTQAGMAAGAPGAPLCLDDFEVYGSGPPSCGDGIQNGDETGIDCGGSCPYCIGPDLSGTWDVLINDGTACPNTSIADSSGSFTVTGSVCDFNLIGAYSAPDEVFLSGSTPLCPSSVSVDAIASSDGNQLIGTFVCSGFSSGSFVASRQILCGNGMLDPGEQCEVGVCCAENCQFLAGTLCRNAAGACDRVEVCGGDSADCPEDQLEVGSTCRDSTGLCDPAETCAGDSVDCPADRQGVVAESPKLTIGKLATPEADDKLSFKGTMALAHPFAPSLDPIAHGVRVVVRDGSGAPVLDATIPAGAYDADTRIGWKVNRKLSKWTYGNKLGIDGVVKVTIADKSARTPGVVAFSVKAKEGSFAVGTIPVSAELTLNGSAPSAQCAIASFPGGEDEPTCTYDSKGNTLKCK